jgi:hypothetical protein
MIDHFDVESTEHDDAWWFLATPKTGHENMISQKTADSIAHQLIGHMPDLLRAWLDRRNGGSPHIPSRKASLVHEGHKSGDPAQPFFFGT